MTFDMFDMVLVRSGTVMFACDAVNVAPDMNHVGRCYLCKNLSLFCKNLIDQVSVSAGSGSELNSAWVLFFHINE